jgi:hypothetical protein
VEVPNERWWYSKLNDKILQFYGETKKKLTFNNSIEPRETELAQEQLLVIN